MNCGSGVIWGVRKCVSGEGLKHILIFPYFRAFRIRYVYCCFSDACNYRYHKMLCFIMSVERNVIGAHIFYRHCLENSRENRNYWAVSWISTFHYKMAAGMPSANCAPSSDGLGKREICWYCIGFIDNSSGQAKCTNSCKSWWVQARGGQESLFELDGFTAIS